MTRTFSDDRDLLIFEPRLFAELAWPAQMIAAGSDGQLDATTFASPSADFVAAGVAPGMVLTARAGSADPADTPVAVEIVAVLSAQQLRVSALRADLDADAVRPALSGTGLLWHVVTFATQAEAVATEMLASFGLWPADATSAFSREQIAHAETLRPLSACGVLATLMAGAAGRTVPPDGFWTKAVHYRRLFERGLARVRVGLDLTGDGEANAARDMGSPRLRRD